MFSHGELQVTITCSSRRFKEKVLDRSKYLPARFVERIPFRDQTNFLNKPSRTILKPNIKEKNGSAVKIPLKEQGKQCTASKFQQKCVVNLRKLKKMDRKENTDFSKLLDSKFNQKCTVPLPRLNLLDLMYKTGKVQKTNLSVGLNPLPVSNYVGSLGKKNSLLVNRLRKVDKVDYFEPTLELSLKEQKPSNQNEKHIPVYKQVVQCAEKAKVNDVYDFDESDSGEEKHKKKKTRRKCSSAGFNPRTYNNFQNPRKRKPRKMKVIRNYEETVNKALQEVIKKVIERKSPQKVNSVEPKNHSNDGYQSEDNFYGFTSKEQGKTGKINILSNILLTPSTKEKVPECDDDYYDNYEHSIDEHYSDDEYFGFDEEDDKSASYNIDRTSLPNANSTIILKQRNNTWRFPNNYKRNPHFLILKKDGLPCLQQDMVLNYSLVESMEKHKLETTNTILEEESSKPILHQTTLLDFVDSASAALEKNKENEAYYSSLYGYEEFIVPKPKPRKVLGSLQYEQIASTPKKDTQIIVFPPDLSVIARDKENSYFGFTSSGSDENVEKSSRSKPFRVNVAQVKKYVKQKDTNDHKDVEEILPTFVENGETLEEASDEIQLFEVKEQEPDMTITIPKMKYGAKRRRRLKSDGLYYSEGEKPKRRKKDVMTKAEKIELEKWASEFNAMCEEVEKYDLNIE